MKIIGITGSMAMGKSTLAHLLKNVAKYPVWDADKEVKKLYLLPVVLQEISKIQENLVVDQKINKEALLNFLQGNPNNLERLEAILYPILAKNRLLFIKRNRRIGQQFVFLDIPLLYEKELDSLCDYIIVVSCPEWLQKKRLSQRNNASKALIPLFKKKQLLSAEKRKRADFIVETGLNRRYALEQVYTFLRWIRVNGT